MKLKGFIIEWVYGGVAAVWCAVREKHVGVEPQPTGLREGVIFGDVQVPGAPAESPYKEVLSGWVESGLSASLSLLDEADSFASSQHLPPLSGTDLTPSS